MELGPYTREEAEKVAALYQGNGQKAAVKPRRGKERLGQQKREEQYMVVIN